ncbi:hypothetical protein DPMN_145295 [Dreissena polymorpha]|uniref:Uncharacterized protein n=1 Tax=Dreissena polymorpha TaxID=45954 RepID=A0A9D4F8B9_DREPO|nr:hypothetical protein DPMN_145295 [Dreissena polymorpha]
MFLLPKVCNEKKYSTQVLCGLRAPKRCSNPCPGQPGKARGNALPPDDWWMVGVIMQFFSTRLMQMNVCAGEVPSTLFFI